MTLPIALLPRSSTTLPLSGWLLSGMLITLFGGCTTAASGGEAGRSVADGLPFNMQPGERVKLTDGSSLRYVEVATDSRCPPDVRCVWEGDAEVVFTRVADSASAQSFTLHTGRGARSQTFDGRRLTLVSLARGSAPQAQLLVEPVR